MRDKNIQTKQQPETCAMRASERDPGIGGGWGEWGMRGLWVQRRSGMRGMMQRVAAPAGRTTMENDRGKKMKCGLF